MTRVPICGANRVTVLPGDWHEDRVVLTLEDKARGLSEVITTTLEHPIHVPGRGFVDAEKLKPGMTVSRWSPSASPLQTVGFRAAEAATGHLLVKAITITRSGLKKWRAYNLTVEGDHTYFVGKTNAWVHNCNASVLRVIQYSGRNADDVVRDLNGATKNRPGGGQWVKSGEGGSSGAAWELEVTGVPKQFAFKVGGVKFDGIQNGTLIDAKDWNSWPINKDFSIADVVAQATRQTNAAGNTPIDWVFSNSAMRNKVRQIFKDNTITGINLR